MDKAILITETPSAGQSEVSVLSAGLHDSLCRTEIYANISLRVIGENRNAHIINRKPLINSSA